MKYDDYDDDKWWEPEEEKPEPLPGEPPGMSEEDKKSRKEWERKNEWVKANLSEGTENLITDLLQKGRTLDEIGRELRDAMEANRLGKPGKDSNWFLYLLDHAGLDVRKEPERFLNKLAMADPRHRPEAQSKFALAAFNGALMNRSTKVLDEYAALSFRVYLDSKGQAIDRLMRIPEVQRQLESAKVPPGHRLSSRYELLGDALIDKSTQTEAKLSKDVYTRYTKALKRDPDVSFNSARGHSDELIIKLRRLIER